MEPDELESLKAFQPNWEAVCEVCCASPTVTATGLCGPCTWGEAETVAGGWWGDADDKRLEELQAINDRDTCGEIGD